MIPAGLLIGADGFNDKSTFPQGAWQGPLIVVLGIVLLVIGGRNLLRSDD
ncbi:MAG: hypothetical protein WD069_16080 [Planctomycetales bacterium]